MGGPDAPFTLEESVPILVDLLLSAQGNARPALCGSLRKDCALVTGTTIKADPHSGFLSDQTAT
jgi:hypothetical protein